MQLNKPLIVAILRFTQLQVPLPPLKPMAQSRRGLTQVLDAKEHPLAKVIPGFIQIHMHLDYPTP
jgi:hypothetical protein